MSILRIWAVVPTLYGTTPIAIRLRDRKGRAILCIALFPQSGDSSGAILGVRSVALLHEVTATLRSPNTTKSYLKVNFLRFFLSLCIFFCTSDAACWKAILISLCSNEFSNIPPKLRSHDAAHTTDTRSFSKIRLPCHSTLLPTSKRAYCKQ